MNNGAALSPAALRAYTRRVALSKRDKLCGIGAVSAYPSLKIRAKADGTCAKIAGTLRCGHIHTCPVCSAALRAERAQLVRHAIDGSDLRWRMLTVTAGHDRDDPLAMLYGGLTRAWRRTRQGGAIQALWTQKVRASVRATEVRWSRANGWHVHFHVLLAGASWRPRERAALFKRWRKAVVDELGEDHAPQQGVPWTDSKGKRRTFDAVYWSKGHDALPEYVAKLGMEVSGYKKDSEYSLSPWDIAERAVKGDKEMRRLWDEYQVATRGRRAIELDDRARAFADVAMARAAAEEREHSAAAPPVVDEREVMLYPDEVLALRVGERVSPGYAWHLVRAVELVPQDAEEVLRRATTFAFEHAGHGYELARYLSNFDACLDVDVGAVDVSLTMSRGRPCRPPPVVGCAEPIPEASGPDPAVAQATARVREERARWLRRVSSGHDPPRVEALSA